MSSFLWDRTGYKVCEMQAEMREIALTLVYMGNVVREDCMLVAFKNSQNKIFKICKIEFYMNEIDNIHTK